MDKSQWLIWEISFTQKNGIEWKIKFECHFVSLVVTEKYTAFPFQIIIIICFRRNFISL